MSPVEEQVIEIGIEEEIRTSYLNYAMTVIVSRALPDVRDGLKAVHRRILYGMHAMGLCPTGGYRKSAKIVGEIMGNYHPHGIAPSMTPSCGWANHSIYGTPWWTGRGTMAPSMGPAAAMRYTEAKLSPIAEELLSDIDKDTVDFGPNYDEIHMEPTVLPTRLPNLLVNGASGIAVGYATNVPMHNLSEVISALLLLLDQPDADLKALLKVLPGPDLTEEERGRVRLVVTEIPYQQGQVD